MSKTSDTTKKLKSRIAELEQTLDQSSRQLAHQNALVEAINQINEVAAGTDDLSTLQAQFEAIAGIAVGLADKLGAASGEIHLINNMGHIHYKSSYAERNKIPPEKWMTLIRRTLTDGLDAWVIKNKQTALITDTETDDRWLKISHKDGAPAVRSAISAPIILERSQMQGAVSYVHPDPNHFDEQDLALLKAIAGPIAVALQNIALLTDLKSNLEETNLIAAISQSLAGAVNLNDVYEALIKGIMQTGPDHCALYLCDDLDDRNVPRQATLTHFQSNISPAPPHTNQPLNIRDYPLFSQAVAEQEPLIVGDIQTDERSTANDQRLLAATETRGLALLPIAQNGRVAVLVTIEYNTPHTFGEQVTTIHQTLINQAAVAIHNARQVERTQHALAGTQALYRAGRLLATTDNTQKALEEALLEFLYSLNLNQGQISLLSADRRHAQPTVCVENFELRPVKTASYPVDEDQEYQNILLSGQPFVSPETSYDPRLDDFFDTTGRPPVRSILLTPIILQGETIGWMEADATAEPRQFSEQEIDLGRAMADQVAVTIRNQRLYDQSQRRADQFKAVAEVGEAVAGLLDLDEILNKTVNLIRDRFGFYHVSIFLLNEAETWAVVRASTGEVGKIMVERPHRLAVGGQSIVGYVTQHGQPRIALDVGLDAVHFDNPLLPNTRSEMALPLIHQANIIGALDVQSEQAGAFTDEDIATLQIMVNQLSTAIINARLFEQTQQRLQEQGILYNIGAKVSATLSLRDSATSLVTETAEALHITECTLSLIEENNTLTTISDHIRGDTCLRLDLGQRLNIENLKAFARAQRIKQEVVIYANNIPADLVTSPEVEFLLSEKGTAMSLTPIMIRNRVIGFIEIYDNQPGRRFTQNNITFLDSIALLATNAIQNARLFESSQRSLARTRNLYELSHTLSRATDLTETFQTALKKYLQLLNLKQGSIMLLDKTGEYHTVQTLIVDGEVVETDMKFPLTDDLAAQHLQKNPEPLVIDNVKTHPLTKDNPQIRSIETEAMLFIPLVIHQEVMGLLVADALTAGYTFTENNVALGEAIADQLSIWLQNRQLFAEAEKRSTLLQTAAEVSRAASSILDTGQLINTSVNLIRNQFNFYYVGLFLVDPTGQWAVLHAGTGQAGQAQIAANHRLKVGGEGMIGWSIANRQPRIALDVGDDAVHFQNPYLPDTRSEMALPLISRGQVLGALTVQSEKESAFSQEDVTLLQTMADQLANAISNARLYQASQKAARREAIIREINSKIAGAFSVEDVMKTTVSELGKVVGATSGGITLNVDNE